MWRDDSLLLDMLIAARRTRQFTAGMTADEFASNRLTQDAVMYRLMTIGEAASNVSKEFCSEHQEIPWAEIVAFRNTLVHEYFRIKVDRVWEVVTRDIPALIELIEPLVPSEDEI
jgi:uncharacterized protein with HEPN domain